MTDGEGVGFNKVTILPTPFWIYGMFEYVHMHIPSFFLFWQSQGLLFVNDFQNKSNCGWIMGIYTSHLFKIVLFRKTKEKIVLFSPAARV